MVKYNKRKMISIMKKILNYITFITENNFFRDQQTFTYFLSSIPVVRYKASKPRIVSSYLTFSFFSIKFGWNWSASFSVSVFFLVSFVCFSLLGYERVGVISEVRQLVVTCVRCKFHKRISELKLLSKFALMII